MSLYKPTSVSLSAEDRKRVASLASILAEKAAEAGAPVPVSHSHVLREAVRLGLDALERRHTVTAPKRSK